MGSEEDDEDAEDVISSRLSYTPSIRSCSSGVRGIPKLANGFSVLTGDEERTPKPRKAAAAAAEVATPAGT
jgi:hypothetical protein